METLQYLIPIISGSLVVPIVSWIKSKLPTDFPIQQVFLTSLLNIGFVYLIAYFIKLPLSLEQALILAGLGQLSSQYGHGIKKTIQENFISK